MQGSEQRENCLQLTHIKLRLASSIGIDLFFISLEEIPSVFNFCKRVLFEEFIVSFSFLCIDPRTPERVNVKVLGENSRD